MSSSSAKVQDQPRCAWIDVAKGIGIILVVYGHVARGAVSAGIPFDPWWFAQLDATVYSFHMPLFFLLSGWFFEGSLARRGKRDFLLARVATVLYPYVLWSLLQGGVELLMSRWTNRPATVAGVLSFAWAPRAQFWFLYTLFAISVLAILLPWRQFGRSISILLLLGVLGCVYQQDLMPPFSFMAGNLIYFAAGILFGASAPSASQAMRMSIFGMAVAAFAVIATGQLVPDGLPLLKLSEAALGIAAVICLSIWLDGKWLGGGLAELGRASVAIYLAHILVASGSRIVLSKAFGVANPWIHVAVGVFAGTLLPWYLWSKALGTGLMGLFEMPARWRQRLAPMLRAPA